MSRAHTLRALSATGVCLWAAALSWADNTYTNNTDVAIVDNSTVTSDIVVNDCYAVANITVSTTMRHTWAGDVTIRLTHVSIGTVRDVVNRVGNNTATPGGDSSNYGNDSPLTVFVYRWDGAFAAGPSGSDIWTEATLGTSAYDLRTGDYKPRTAAVGAGQGGFSDLSTAFNGESVGGTWRLSIQDSAGGDTGLLDSWSLIVTPGAPAPPTASNVSTHANPNQNISIALSGSGCGTLSYIIDSLPTLGTLSDPNGGTISSTPYTLLANGSSVNYAASNTTGGDTFNYHVNDGSSNSNTATVSVDVSYRYISTDTPVAIPDNNPAGATSTINVPDAFCISDLNVRVDITHTFIGDLTVDLTSPNGTVVRLHNNTGGSADDIHKLYDDGVTNPDGPGTLSNFNGQLITGNWTLKMVDNAASDVGTLTSWYLAPTPASCNPVASNVAASTPANTPVAVTLSAVSPLGNPLTYIITSLPVNGSLSDPNAGAITTMPYTLAASGNIVDYTPNTNFGGLDSFQYKANDGADSNTATVSLVINQIVIFDEPLDSDPGWSIEGAGWAFGTPTGGGSHTFDPTSGHTGTNVYGYNLAGDYANSMATTEHLTTVAFNLTGAYATELRFWRWLGVESNSFDHATVEVSNDGSIWTPVFANGSTSISDAAWSQQIYSISAVADNQATVYVRWGMGTTDGSVTYPGWNIDDVQIYGTQNVANVCIPCDVNCDGSVNQFDIQDFVDALSPSPPTGCSPCAADANQDGTVNQFDINEFIDCLNP